MRLGCHIPFNGFYNTLLDATSLGFSTFQIFIRNNRSLKARDYSDADIELFNSKIGVDIDAFVVHASYALNPASGYDNIREKTMRIIRSDMLVLNKLKGEKYYVLHPGASTDFSDREALDTLIKTLHELADCYGHVKIAVEFMSGQGTQLIKDLEQLAYLLLNCDDIPQFCVCLDTAHMFSAGFDFDKVLAIFNVLNMNHRLGPVHINGSAKPFGSRVDRHSNLFDGCLPVDTIHSFIDKLYSVKHDCVLILETPSERQLLDFTYLSSEHIFCK